MVNQDSIQELWENIKLKTNILHSKHYYIKNRNMKEKKIDYSKDITPAYYIRSIYGYKVKDIIRDFKSYQHSVGEFEEELSWLPNIEYFDRTRVQLMRERNILKKFTMDWNKT